MYCASCGTDVETTHRFCPSCGGTVGTLAGDAPATTPATPAAVANVAGARPATGTRETNSHAFVQPRNPPLSPHLSWLALLLPGLPHWIYGQVAKGFVWLGLSLVLLSTVVGWLIVAALSAIDSYKVAKKLASGRPVGKFEWFPSR